MGDAVTASVVVWAILIGLATTLAFIGFWFSLQTLRFFSLGTGVILTVLVTLFGLAHPDAVTTSLVGAFLNGVDKVTGALMHLFWWGRKVPSPGVAGRWVIAATFLLGYRQLEAWSLRWQAPELDLSRIGPGLPPAEGNSPGAKAGNVTALKADILSDLSGVAEHAELGAELRFRLTTMEVRAPAILPGGTKAKALASIAETSGVSGAGMLSAAFRLAGLFWPQPRRLRVRTWVERVPDPPCRRITVLLEDAKTGLPISTGTVTGTTKQEAASMVAGYIARQIFAMDRTVPESCYGVADGRDLGAMQLARLERVHAECPRGMADSRDKQIRILCQSAGVVRTAGIIRYELAQLLALRREHLQALRLHAINRELHPRFYRGRYRLAMSLAMIANREHYLPDTEETVGLLAEVMRILERCGLADTTPDVRAQLERVHVAEPCGEESGEVRSCLQLKPALAGKLLDAAREDLRGVREQLRASRVVRDALLRRRERAVWLPHWNPGHRKAFVDGVCVAELLIAVRRSLLGPDQHRPAPPRDKRDRRQLRRAIAITSFAGDTALIQRVLEPGADARWWIPSAGETSSGKTPDTRSWSMRRRGPAPSWQAAYNTACVYAALADAALPQLTATRDQLAQMAQAKRQAARATWEWTMVAETVPAETLAAEVAQLAVAHEEASLGRATLGEMTLQHDKEGELATLKKIQNRVIKSLRYVVDDRTAELERPSDWIDSDPDFHFMYQHPLIFAEFNQFLLEQIRQDYPVAFYRGTCPRPHTPRSSARDDPEHWPGWAEAQIISPVRGHPVKPRAEGAPGNLAPAARASDSASR